MNYSKGRPLTCGELRAAPIGTPVWLVYTKEFGKGVRINEVLTIQSAPNEDGEYDMHDNAGFLCTFSLRGAASTADDAPAEEYEHGHTALFVAVQNTESSQCS